MKNPQVLIVNLGSQYTDLIGRSLRELGVRSAILPPTKAAEWLLANKPKGIILSGSDASVNDADAPQPPETVFSASAPILGICYGMQWLAKRFDGEVRSGTGEGNYGETIITFGQGQEDGGLWYGVWNSGGNQHKVHASHGDIVSRIPVGFCTIAWPYSHKDLGVMGMADLKSRLWGVQFHPEVDDTVAGKQMLANFVFKIAECEKDWNPRHLAEEIRGETVEAIGGRDVTIGVSGGVDSTTLLALIAPMLREKLHPIIIDAGNLREGEQQEILENVRSAGVCGPRVIHEPEKFVEAVSRTIDAEEKRKAFSQNYWDIFNSETQRFKGSVVVQGSLAPDFIESGKTGGATIVSHHNMGPGIHPFRRLFKYEVRELGKELGLPDSVCKRQPFPGPGLFVRIVGQSVTFGRLEIVRWADARVRDILTKAGEYQKMSQLVVGLLCINIGGVKGDARSYKPIIGVRGIVTSDFMTGRGYQIAPEVRREITRTLTKHPDIGRVGYYEEDKPPGRTEFE